MEMRHRLNRYFARDPRSLRRRTEPLPKARPSRLITLLEALLEETPWIGPALRRRRQRLRVDPWTPAAPPLPGELESPQFIYAWAIFFVGASLLISFFWVGELFFFFLGDALWGGLIILFAIIWYVRTLFAPQQLTRNAFDQGIELLLGEEGHAGEAAARFKHALEHRPKTRTLGKLLAAAQFLAGDPETAQETVTAYLQTFEVDLGARLLRADILSHLGRPKTAFEAVDDALAFHPEAAEELAVINMRGELLLALGRPADALTTLELHHPRFIPDTWTGDRPELTPEEVEHHRLRAQALTALEQETEASEHRRLVDQFDRGGA